MGVQISNDDQAGIVWEVWLWSMDAAGSHDAPMQNPPGAMVIVDRRCNLQW